jgi:PTH1 family peptidyl-tRNA hydrolase
MSAASSVAAALVTLLRFWRESARAALAAALGPGHAWLRPAQLEAGGGGSVSGAGGAGSGSRPGTRSGPSPGSCAMVGKLLVVGLGNWGSIRSRHSVGAAVVRRLAESRGLQWRRAKDAQVASDGELVLVEPRLFMNVNGKCLTPSLLRDELGLPSLRDALPRLVLVQDDLERAVGKLSVKEGGSAGGHNGVRSVIAQAGGVDVFRRLRVGIGRPEGGAAYVAQYVLEDFSRDELSKLDLDAAARLLEGLVATPDQGAGAAAAAAAAAAASAAPGPTPRKR